MDTQNLLTFLTVERLRNFTHAATELNYAQSTISNQIKQLEKELGYPLFDRIGKELSLTPMGKHFKPYAEEIFFIMQRIEVTQKRPEEMQGLLRVGALDSLIYSDLVDVLPLYKKTYKNIDLNVNMGIRDVLIKRLKNNFLDMLYISDDAVTDPTLECCYKRPERLIFVSDRNHGLAKREYIPLQEILSYPFIGLEQKGVCRARLDAVANSLNLFPTFTVNIENIKALTILLSSLGGLAFLPEYAIKDELNSGTLIELDVDMEPQVYYVQIIYCKNKWIPPFMQGMIDIIKTCRPA